MTEPTPEELDQALRDARRILKEAEAAANVQKASKEAERKLQERAQKYLDDKNK